MKKILLLSFCFLYVSFIHCAIAQPIIPSPPNLAAKSWILMDAKTGSILSEQNADIPMPPASMTKMMTSYIVASELQNQRLSIEQVLPVSVNAWRKGGAKTGGSTMFLEAKSSIPVIDLLNGLIVQSGNDAAIVLAEYLAGDTESFAKLMNQQAKALGMENTNFVNSTGWPDPKHYSTAKDLALLAQAIIYDYPEHYRLYSKKSYTYNGIRQRNRNTLLWQDPSVDGVKTGSTEEAGYCLTASAEKNGMRLISVILGSDSKTRRNEDSKKLLAWGFRYFTTHRLYSAGDTIKASRVWKGTTDTLNITSQDDIILTLPRSNDNKLKVETSIQDYLEAPINEGDKIGHIKVFLSDALLYKGALISANDVGKADLLNSIWDSIHYFVIDIMN